MPTLYNGTCECPKLYKWSVSKFFCDGPVNDFFFSISGVEPLKTKPNLSIVELVLYNMAAMLAGVASGYDVRLSNVSPVHPTLRPDG